MARPINLMMNFGGKKKKYFSKKSGRVVEGRRKYVPRDIDVKMKEDMLITPQKRPKEIFVSTGNPAYEFMLPETAEKHEMLDAWKEKTKEDTDIALETARRKADVWRTKSEDDADIALETARRKADVYKGMREPTEFERKKLMLLTAMARERGIVGERYVDLAGKGYKIAPVHQGMLIRARKFYEKQGLTKEEATKKAASIVNKVLRARNEERAKEKMRTLRERLAGKELGFSAMRRQKFSKLKLL